MLVGNNILVDNMCTTQITIIVIGELKRTKTYRWTMCRPDRRPSYCSRMQTRRATTTGASTTSRCRYRNTCAGHGPFGWPRTPTGSNVFDRRPGRFSAAGSCGSRGTRSNRRPPSTRPRCPSRCPRAIRLDICYCVERRRRCRPPSRRMICKTEQVATRHL